MSHHAPPPASAIRRVPVGATVAAVYRAVFGHLGLLARAAAVPLVLSVGIAMVSLVMPPGPGTMLVSGLLALVPYALFGVAWHRLTLLGPVVGAPVAVPAWTRRHWKFLGYTVAVMVVGYAVSLPMGIVIGLIASTAQGGHISGGLGGLILGAMVAAAVALGYVSARLSFVFPAVSVDERYRLSHAWVHTAGQGMRLLWIMVLVAAPMVGVMLAVNALLGSILVPEASVPVGPDGMRAPGAMRDYVTANAGEVLLGQAVFSALNYVLTALLLASISIAFRVATGWVPAPESGTTDLEPTDPEP